MYVHCLHISATRFFLSISLWKKPQTGAVIKSMCIQKKPHPVVAVEFVHDTSIREVSHAGLELFSVMAGLSIWDQLGLLRADNLTGIFRMLTTLCSVEIFNNFFIFAIYLGTFFVNSHSKMYLSFIACVTSLTGSSTRPTLFASSALY